MVYLTAFQFVPVDRRATQMTDLFGLSLSRDHRTDEPAGENAPAGLCGCGASVDLRRRGEAPHNQAERDSPDDEVEAENLRLLPLSPRRNDFAAIRTLIGTAKKRGWGVVIQSLMRDPQDLIDDLFAA